jgi:hypothetical protein
LVIDLHEVEMSNENVDCILCSMSYYPCFN